MPGVAELQQKASGTGGGTMSRPSLLSYPSGARHTRALGV